MKRTQDTMYLDVARVVSCFAVVMIHVLCTPIVFCQNDYSAVELFIVKSLRNSLNWCVPIFVMISGILFLNPEKEIPIKKLFGKYIKRLFIVIITFGTLYALMEIVFNERKFEPLQILEALRNAILGKSWNHMWYIYMAIGIYMISPALKIFVSNAEDKIILYTLTIIFVFSSILPFASIFFDFENYFPQISIYIFYMIFGYAIHYRKLELKTNHSLFIIAGFCVYVSLLQTNDFFYIENNAALLGTAYSSPFTLITAWAVFSLCKKAKSQSKFIRFLSPLTFGIYVLHPIPINFCYKVMHLTVEKYAFFPSLLAVTITTFLFSILGTFILRCIPFVRKNIL